MNATDRKRFAMAVGVLGETYGRPVTEVTIRAYEIGMAGLPIIAIERAVNRAVTESKFMPVPAELRELSGELMPSDRAIKAWAAVQAAMRGHDYYDTVVFDDPVTTATVRHLWHDWMQFTEASESDDEKWMRKEFERVYCSLLRSGISREATRPLLGFFEKENRLHGKMVQPPLMIACGLPKLSTLRISTEPSVQQPETVRLLENIGVMP